MRSATAAARTPIRSEAWLSSIIELRLSTATRARAALVAATEGREDGPAVPRRILASFGHPSGDDADERRDEQGGERDRQVDLGLSDLERSAQPQLGELV